MSEVWALSLAPVAALGVGLLAAWLQQRRSTAKTDRDCRDFDDEWLVALALAEGEACASDVWQVTGLRGKRLFHALDRMLRAKHITDRWTNEGRRIYRLRGMESR